ncbi:hypothetical protein INQ42_01830 [Lysobacter avium]|uniref:Transmembrane protein n=2 Tax=Novilysobacter avium TaxID=2781023 RepID=A0A7S6UL96_9GAMM|nr:hypothetical protein INQ42_01830 [Lysobacter avium]
MGKTETTRYVIVPHRRGRRTMLLSALVAGWLGSLLLVWAATSLHAAPQLPGLKTAAATAQTELAAARASLHELSQRAATLERSDQISRVANQELQEEMSQREEEISGLRANLAFYERVAGPAAKQRKGLTVHSLEFKPERAGTWRYQAVLTQNLAQGAISSGKLRFAIEGVRDGKLATVGWTDLHQSSAAPPQDYAFRYFQQLEGSVMLPPGFTPQRVRVALRGGSANVDQALAWTQSPQHGET